MITVKKLICLFSLDQISSSVDNSSAPCIESIGPSNIQTVLVAAPVVGLIMTVVCVAKRASITPVESPSGISLSSNPKPLVSLTDSERNLIVDCLLTFTPSSKTEE